MNDELKDLEKTLSRLQPTELSTDFLKRLDSAMSQWKDKEEEEKIVQFEPVVEEVQVELPPRRVGWAAAAAVAILGGSAAMMFSPGSSIESDSVASQAAPVAPAQVAPAPSPTTDGVYNVSATGGDIYRDEAEQPMRRFTVDFIELLQLEDKQGRRLLIEVPRRELLVVPMEED